MKLGSYVGICLVMLTDKSKCLNKILPMLLLFALALLVFLVDIGLCVNGYHISKEYIKIKPHRYVIGKEDRDTFLSRIIHSYQMFQYINTHLPADAKIFFIYMRNFGFLCNRAYYSDSIIESYTIQKMFSQPQAPEEVHCFLRKSGFTHILYDTNYVTGAQSAFNDRQKQLFLDC